MEHGILAFLQGADKTMAWAAAVALAAGGTALFVAFYLQWQRWRASAAMRRDARRAAAGARRGRPETKRAGRPATSVPATVAPATGVAAYRQQSGSTPAPVLATKAAGEETAPPVRSPAHPKLDPLLARLQDAGDRLEELVRRQTSRAHEQDDMARLAAAIDVEFLHKQA